MKKLGPSLLIFAAMFAAIAASMDATAADRVSVAGPRVGGPLLSAPPFATLSCENGQTYPIVARAVSVAGDLVTGYLVLSPRHAVHIRLIPMTDGYRYAGRGIWLDGLRTVAVLSFGKYQTVSCNVTIG
jgi:hypothetical protein